MKYTIGLDLGIASCGAAAIELDEQGDAKRILSMHSRTFEIAEVPKTGASLAVARREARGLRRRLRRKALRLADIRELLGFADMSKQKDDCDVNELRLKVLDQKISEREFARVLYTIAKNRGFKSNRKNNASKEDGKLLKATINNQNIMQEGNYRTIGEMLIKHYAQKDCNGNLIYCIHNKDSVYEKNVQRQALIDEINYIFDKQKAFGNTLANDDIKEKYLEIFSRQRSFDEGPGKGSQYKSNFLVGKCEYDNEYRAPKYSFTADYSVALQKINNLHINSNGQSRTLTDEERKIVIDMLMNTSEVKYKQIRKKLGLGLDSTFNMLSYVMPKDKEMAFEELVAKVEDKAFVSLKNSNTIAKVLKEDNKKAEIIDEIATILLFNKSQERIYKAIQASDMLKTRLSIEEIQAIYELDCIKTNNLSLSVLKSIQPYLEAGKKYTEALDMAGYKVAEEEKLMYLGGEKLRERINEITSPVVKRAVTQAIKVINALIREYGSPAFINIELARELSKTFEERQKIKRENDKRYKLNEEQKQELEKELKRAVKTSDLIKYRLYKEQNCKCPYSGLVIDRARLFGDDNYVQIDHILPYSKSFDDSYNNKVLVLTKENQDKKNMTALEYAKSIGKENEYRSRIIAMYYDNPAKKDKLLKEKIDEDEWKNRALNDTSYLSRFVQNMLQDFLYFEPCKNAKRNVFAVKGRMTATLRRLWGINKIREDGDLHHAVDAAIIAVTTNKSMQAISNYYKIKEYIKSGDDYVEPTTGEILGYKELDNILKQGTLPPYKNFVNELRARTLQDKESMDEELAKLGYGQEELAKVKPIFVSRMPVYKSLGAIHKDTYTSVKHKDGQLRSKKPLTDLKYDEKTRKFSNYTREDDPALYDLLIKRVEEFNGDVNKAFAEPIYKPTKNGRQGPIVKKLKLIADFKSGVYIEKTKTMVANDAMIRVDIFTKDNKYYGVPIYVSDLYKGILPSKVAVALKEESEWLDIDESYKFLFSLYKNDLLYITHKKGIELKKILDSQKSKLPKTKMTNSMLYYYGGFGRSTCSISITDNSNCYCVKNLGITTLQELKKCKVDVLGNVSEVKKEKRMPLKLKTQQGE